MSNYSTAVASLTQQIQAREKALPLRNLACQSRFLLKPLPTQKVCLFFHGFTSTPQQFMPMGEALFKAGYNVLIPLLPGHGQAGNWQAKSPPPLPEHPQTYQQFALKWLQHAQLLGNQVIVGGLSGGGTLAGWLALEQPQQVYRSILFAPYLSSSSKVLDLFVRLVDGYCTWSLKPGDEPLGYSGFAVAALRVFLSLGKDILDRTAAGAATAPLFMISSESDQAVGNEDHEALFKSALVKQPRCWYNRFSRVMDIPHTMMTQAEGNQYASLLVTMTKAFAESSLTWAEVEEIGYQMTQGKTFSQVVTRLNLGSRVSPDMPAMMTLVDKRAIVLARNPSFRPRS